MPGTRTINLWAGRRTIMLRNCYRQRFVRMSYLSVFLLCLCHVVLPGSGGKKSCLRLTCSLRRPPLVLIASSDAGLASGEDTRRSISSSGTDFRDRPRAQYAISPAAVRTHRRRSSCFVFITNEAKIEM